MTTFTKQTIITYQDAVDMVPQGYLNALMLKATQLEVAGKTDATWIFLDEYRSKRLWLDQDSADQWVQFVATEADLYNVVITDFEIGDNTAPV